MTGSESPGDRFVEGYELGLDVGKKDSLIQLRHMIQSDLDCSRTFALDIAGLRKALLIIERMERNLR